MLAKELRSALGTILMVDSVKSISTDPLGKPVVGSRVDEGGFRQMAVKAGVKHGHLRHGSKFARDDFNAF